MLRLFRYLIVWIVATVACLAGLVVTAPLIAAVPGQIALPLATGLGALFASVAANFVSNGFASDRSRGRLLLIVGVTEVMGAAVAVGLIAAFILLGGGRGPLAPFIYPLLACAGVIALSTTVASGLLRTTDGSLQRDCSYAAGLITLSLLMVIVVPVALCSTVISCIP